MKRHKLWSRRNVPEHLWPDILARLPVKTLLRFRCVSKQWRSLIDDPDFARLHLRRPLSNKKLEVRRIPSLKPTPRINFPQAMYSNQGPSWHLFFSRDGLFMLKKNTRPPELMLWNPATRKTLTLPPSPEISSPVTLLYTDDLGLGFDPSSKDYKHVRLIHTSVGDLHSVAIYSLATMSWKMTRSHQGIRHRFCCVGRMGLCLQGFMFQLFKNIAYDLISFDFSSETLTFITLPVNDGNAVYPPSLTMADDGCSLAVVFCSGGSGSLWVFEGLGADDVKSCTWSKRYTFSSMFPAFDGLTSGGSFFYLLKNGEMLIRWHDMVTSYNLKTNKEKVVEKKQLGDFALPYAESLLAIPN